jgi:hypothetical protein
MVDLLNAEVLGVKPTGDLEVRHGGDALAEPLVLRLGVSVAALGAEYALNGCDTADREPTIDSEGVSVASAGVLVLCYKGVS